MSMIASAGPELSTALDRIDVVVQNVASFRIDPAVLARPDRETALIVSTTSVAHNASRRSFFQPVPCTVMLVAMP